MAGRTYMPTEKERARVRAEHDRMYAVMDFWADHRDELLASYGEAYVAVKDPLGDYTVVATDSDIVTLLETVESRGLDRRDVEIEFVTSRVPDLMWVVSE